MAVSFVGEVGRAETTYSAYPEEIILNPELNGRHENPDVETLAADIAANGQYMPVVCYKNDEGRPVLAFGHRRYRAICLLNELNPTNPRKVVFTYRKFDETEAFIAAIGENRFRKDVSPIDDAANMEILRRKFGKTPQDIAAIYFPEAKIAEEHKAALKFVGDRIALIELAPEAAQAVRDGRIKLTSAVALSKLSRDLQKRKVAKAGKIKGKDITGSKSKAEPAPAAASLPQLPSAFVPENIKNLVGFIWSAIETVDNDEIDDPVLGWVQIHRKELVELRNYLATLKV